MLKNKNYVLPIVLFHLFITGLITAQKIDPTELKCLVCEKTIGEIEKLVANVDPTVQVDAGGYRLDGQGNIKRKTISQAISEVYLSEMLEQVCEKMDDYVRARWKTTGQLTLMKLIDSDGKMSLDMNKMDIVQDSDLNKSLKYYCEILIEEHEDAIIKNLANGADDIDIQVCSLTAGYCNRKLPQDEL